MQDLWDGRTGCVLAHRRRARRWSRVRACRSLTGVAEVSGSDPVAMSAADMFMIDGEKDCG